MRSPRAGAANPGSGDLTALDTNVLVRILAADDAAQARRAMAVVEAGPVWIPKSVLLETVWVLRGAYGLPEDRLRELVVGLLALERVGVESRAEVEQAVAWWGEGLDFADALHLAASSPAKRFATFARAFARRARKIATLPPVDPI